MAEWKQIRLFSENTPIDLEHFRMPSANRRIYTEDREAFRLAWDQCTQAGGISIVVATYRRILAEALDMPSEEKAYEAIEKVFAERRKQQRTNKMYCEVLHATAVTSFLAHWGDISRFDQFGADILGCQTLSRPENGFAEKYLIDAWLSPRYFPNDTDTNEERERRQHHALILPFYEKVVRRKVIA